jgi:uridylate kinase
MNNTPHLSVLSIGGSLLVPQSEVQTDFLRALRALILKEVRRGERFVLVVGGGGTSREYQHAARSVGGLTRDDLDWLGIHTTRLNGHLLRTIFRAVAYPIVLKDPSRKLQRPWTEPVMVAAGWKPGWSTDYIATRLAKRLKTPCVFNMTNVDYLYDKDPRKHREAKPIKKISWSQYRKLVGNRWDPGLHLPFDPVASRLAQQSKMKVILLGSSMKNLERCLHGESFRGSVIS